MKIQELDFDITKYHKCLSDLYWHGCYEGDSYFKQYFEPSTYAHPAKISPLLADRIFRHLEKLELLKEGMTILDFMSGSGRVPLLASLRGYKSIGIELEPHFVKMCNDNKKFAENKIGRKLDMTIVQGDSRQLSKLLNKSDVAVISPPFENSIGSGKSGLIGHFNKNTGGAHTLTEKTYGDNSDNIGNLPYVAVVSPPFENQLGTNPQNRQKIIDNMVKLYKEGKLKGTQKGDFRASLEKEFNKDYGNNPSNIGNLPYKSMVGVVSPPYQDSISGGKSGIEWQKEWGRPSESRQPSQDVEYSQNPENIGNLKDTGIVGITSPPYENSEEWGDKDFAKRVWEWRNKGFFGENQIRPSNTTIREIEKEKQSIYAPSDNNLGKQQGQNYLSAMLQVYKEASKVCPIIAVVTKNPTRAGKLRRLDLDTKNLLEMAGYEIVDFHRAVLFQTNWQQTLDGKNKPEYKGRLSFFKRLSLQKGNVASQWEDIIIGVRK